MQSKSVLSDDFTKLVEEYISSIVHLGETLNEEACRGLRRLGIAADKNITVVYIGLRRVENCRLSGVGEKRTRVGDFFQSSIHGGSYVFEYPDYLNKTYQSLVADFLAAVRNEYGDGETDVIDLSKLNSKRERK